jgi:hypothetical protein
LYLSSTKKPETMKKILLSLSVFFLFSSAKAQLTINDTLTTTQITNLLEGFGVTVSGLTVNCPPLAMGEFNGTSEMAITHGIVLTSGSARAAADSVTAFASGGGMGYPGDSDLNVLSGAMTYDACVLEFDCLPVGDTLLFNFSFGSEEYPEFVGSFNDVFAIFISGPGIPGVVNCAAIPGGTPVAINNVNDVTNSMYYYNNESPAGQYVAYDGFTTNLTAFAEVTPGALYHFKVAIADAMDAIFDSGVFLEAFSFRSVMADPTGVKEEAALAVSVFPNPGTGSYTLRDKKQNLIGSTLTVMNVLGEVVLSKQISEESTMFDLTEYSSGIYFVNVNSVDGTLSQKIIKK